jgi:type IV pilus assembly protein PilA
MQGNHVRGFTLILIVIVLGVAAIVAAVGFPAYQDHTIRARVNELVRAAAACKSAVSDFYQARGFLPASAKEAGCPERVTAHANPLAVFKGEVIVQAVGVLASELGPRNIFAMRAVCSDGACAGARIVEWSCSATGRAGSSTTIPPKYLPPACR